jgi:acyl-CoA thioesterase-1
MAKSVPSGTVGFSNGNISARFLGGRVTWPVAKAFVVATALTSFQFGTLSGVSAASIGLGTGPVIVAAFGTSLTHNSGWLTPLEEKLTRCLGRRVAVLDFGKDGGTSDWALKSVRQVTEAHPDVVLIEFSANDAAWFKGFSLRRSRENTGKIVQRILAALPETKIFLMTMSPALGPRRWIRLNLDAYYSLYESLASELGIGYIDNRPAWRALPENELRAGIPDGAHPLPELVSRLLVPTISKAIVPGCTDSGS